ncbi:MAG TPA: response regulator [Gaiellaceae bacterium]
MDRAPDTAPLVLVADDDADIARLVCHHLRRIGLRTLQVSEGVEALRVAMQERPDLLVLDIGMPGLEGTAVSRIVHARGEQAPPVIFLTARTRERDRAEAFAAGAVDYVTKPFTGRDLTARVLAVLAAAE